MKKMLFSILLMCGLVLIITGCGSKLDKTGEEFKNAIIKENSENDGREYKDSDFSFLIYEDKDAKQYLADVLVPVKNRSSVLEYFYCYDVNKELEKTESKASFNDVKSKGNYEVVYKSGKFK